MITHVDLVRRFAYHTPTGNKIQRHQRIRQMALNFATAILEEIPDDSKERSLAIEKVEEATMWANAAIAREIA